MAIPVNEKADKRRAELEALHADGEPVRLQVNPNGPNLIEKIHGQDKHFSPGEVFEHPAPRRAAQLLAMRHANGTPVVIATKLLTKAEEAKKAAITKEAIDRVVEQERAKATKILQERQAKLDKLEAALRKMPAEALAKELETRKLTAAENLDAKINAILADEKAKLETA